MKRIAYLILLVTVSAAAFAQIPNANFETWNTVTTENPQLWQSTGKVSKVTGGQQGSYAVKLETDLNNIFNPVADIALSGQAYGVPYSGNPDTIRMWIKYNIANADTATFHAEMLNGTTLVRAGDFFLTVGSSSNWVEISIPMLPYDTTVTPDTMYFEIYNTNYSNPQATSWIIVDNIRGYKNGTLQAAMPNYSFENWTSSTSKTCAGWFTTNEIFKSYGIDSVNVIQSTDAQNGSSAVFMRNLDYFGNMLPGGLVTGNNPDAALTPDMIATIPVADRYSSLSGYFKFTKKVSDQGEVSVYMFSGGTKVGEGHFYPAVTQSTYLLFEAKITYDMAFTGIPDSATIYMAATRDPQNVTGTSSMLIDNLQFNKWALGIKSKAETIFSIYPNPSTDMIHLKGVNDGATVMILGMDGKEITTAFTANNTINIAALQAGIYILRVMDSGNIYTARFTKL
jgi:hypothetical protein